MGVLSFVGKELGGKLLKGALAGAAVNGGAEAIHGVANGDFDMNRVAYAAGIGAGASVLGEGAARGVGRGARKSIEGLDDDIVKLNQSKTAGEQRVNDLGNAPGELQTAYKAKRNADIAWQKSRGRLGRGKGDPNLALDKDLADQALAEKLGIKKEDLPGAKDLSQLDDLVTKQKGKYAADKRIAELDNQALDGKLEGLEKQKKKFESRTKLSEKGWRGGSVAAATAGTWMFYPRGGDSGGSGGNGGGKPSGPTGGGSTAVPMEWAGGQFAGDKPFVPRPDLYPDVQAGTGGPLIVPTSLDPRIRVWYVGE